MNIEILILLITFSFVLEFFDASAGMGYGLLTPILLLMGFAPLETISAVILTSAVLSLLTGYLHHGFKNINFLVKKNLQVLSVLVGFGIIAIIIGAIVAIRIPKTILKGYIGFLVIAIGISIIIKHHKKIKFSWKRLIAFGSVASFNKGISGGGYGPVLSGGQIISGIKSKYAVGITALSEGIISLVGFLIYLGINGPKHMNWMLIIALLIGGTISTPIAAYFVKKTDSQKLKYFIGVVSITLGLIILFKLFV